MKKTNNVKVNNAKATAVAEQQTNKKANKTNAANTKIDAKQLTTVHLYDDVSVTLEAKTLSEMKFWAYHVTKELSDFFIDLNFVVDAGDTPTIDPYTEDELNKMIATAGFAINFFDPNDTEVYRDYYNAYGCCRYIIDRCIDLTHVLHGNYDSLGWVKSKYKHSELPINIENVYHRLYNLQTRIDYKIDTEIPYTRDELYSIIGKAVRTLDDLNTYDCSDICTVEVTKYLCNEVIDIVNYLFAAMEHDDAITCKDNKKNTAIGYDEYDDF